MDLATGTEIPVCCLKITQRRGTTMPSLRDGPFFGSALHNLRAKRELIIHGQFQNLRCSEPVNSAGSQPHRNICTLSNQSLSKDLTRDWTNNPWPCHKFHFDLTPENLSIRPKSKHVHSVNRAAVGDLLPVNTFLRTWFDRLKISSCGLWARNNPALFSHTKRRTDAHCW